MDPSTGRDADLAVHFRPSKKRKTTYRQRSGDVLDDTPATAPPTASLPPLAATRQRRSPESSPRRSSRSRSWSRSRGVDRGDHDKDDEPAVAAAVRMRSNARRARFRGVGFAPETRQDGDADDDNDDDDVAAAASSSKALALRGPDSPGDDERAPAAVVQGIAGRFMRQTGLVADPNDRHMTEWIESRLSSRNAPPSAPPPPSSSYSSSSVQHHQHPPSTADRRGGTAPNGQAAAPATATGKSADQSTKHGKLFEVDIPADVRGRLDDAKRRLPERAPRPRFGRNRRNSDDVKRDQFVEQFLHENRLDVYDFPKQSSTPAMNPGDHRTADERMAEQFRRQYLDELAQRRQRRRAAHPPRQQPPPGDVLKGPKLGGSRNARAAVRNALLQQEKEKVGRKT